MASNASESAVVSMPVAVMDERLVRWSRRAHQGLDTMREIDAVAAQLYAVTPKEVELLRAFVARRLDAR